MPTALSPNNAIFAPMLALMLLTFVVWVVLYVLRLRFLIGNKVDASKLTTPYQRAVVIPEEVNYPAFNFQNLFELPVLFYGLCLYLHVTGQVDNLYVNLAWAFVAGRLVHSIVHSTVNIVKVRFLVYMLSAIALWVMLLRAAGQYFL